MVPLGVSNTLDYMHVELLYYIEMAALYQKLISTQLYGLARLSIESALKIDQNLSCNNKSLSKHLSNPAEAILILFGKFRQRDRQNGYSLNLTIIIYLSRIPRQITGSSLDSQDFHFTSPLLL